ncbi:zinc finger, CCHC-type containing protein [Tanacetum coccineum]
MDSDRTHNAAEVLVSISRPRGFEAFLSQTNSPQQPTQGAVRRRKRQRNSDSGLAGIGYVYIKELTGYMDDDAWWVDSGATVHVCKDRCWFHMGHESTALEHGSILCRIMMLRGGSILHMGNESTALVHGHGCVDLRFSSGNIIFLFNVFHVPNIRKNLVSSSILILILYTIKLGSTLSQPPNYCMNLIYWHARLGHVHFNRKQDMSKMGLILAFDMDTEKCKTCMLTKIIKKPFQNIKREIKVLELIRNDLCDLHATPSLGNKKYFVTFIDDASRKGLKRQKEAKTIKNRQETGKRQRVKSKSEKSARDHSRISPTQSKKEIKEVKSQTTSQRAKVVKFSKSQGLTWSFEV